jgi:hypothetical protein
MILKKLNNNHYVILADEKTLSNNGDWYLSHPDYNKVVQWNMLENTQHEGKQVWINKILYSTQPLDTIILKNRDRSHTTGNHYGEIGKLSLSEVEELILGYNVEDIADSKVNDVILKEGKYWNNQDAREPVYYGVIEGFNTCKELVKDKLFTIEPLEYLLNILTYDDLDEEEKIESCKDYIRDLLLPKTEWEVKEITPEGKIVLL